MLWADADHDAAAVEQVAAADAAAVELSDAQVPPWEGGAHQAPRDLIRRRQASPPRVAPALQAPPSAGTVNRSFRNVTNQLPSEAKQSSSALRLWGFSSGGN
jgi:hypothetical protein